MTCAQGLLRLLWGGPEVGVLRDWLYDLILLIKRMQFLTKKINYDMPLIKLDVYGTTKILVQEKKPRPI